MQSKFVSLRGCVVAAVCGTIASVAGKYAFDDNYTKSASSAVCVLSLSLYSHLHSIMQHTLLANAWNFLLYSFAAWLPQPNEQTQWLSTCSHTMLWPCKAVCVLCVLSLNGVMLNALVKSMKSLVFCCSLFLFLSFVFVCFVSVCFLFIFVSFVAFVV